jgi:hypothetical protein
MTGQMNPGPGTGLPEGRQPSAQEVSTMAATIDLEFESGVYTDAVRRHQGYWAGDFSESSEARDAA